METSWVDLLDKNGLKSPQRTRVTVKVSDSTPRGKVGTKWNTPNSYLLHRTTPTVSDEGWQVDGLLFVGNSYELMDKCLYRVAENLVLVKNY